MQLELNGQWIRQTMFPLNNAEHLEKVVLVVIGLFGPISFFIEVDLFPKLLDCMQWSGGVKYSLSPCRPLVAIYRMGFGGKVFPNQVLTVK